VEKRPCASFFFVDLFDFGASSFFVEGADFGASSFFVEGADFGASSFFFVSASTVESASTTNFPAANPKLSRNPPSWFCLFNPVSFSCFFNSSSLLAL
jgi:hypothetical protein